MVVLRWKYNLRADIAETTFNLRNEGFTALQLEGLSKNRLEPYPLNQLKVSGGGLSPNIKVHVGPNVTQIYYYLNNLPELGGFEKVVSDVEDAERTLNCTIIFAPNETARFGQDTAIPVTSISLLKLQMKLKDEYAKALDKIEEIAYSEVDKALCEMAQGRPQQALIRINLWLGELTRFQTDLIKLAKELGNPNAEKWEANLKNILSSPLGKMAFKNDLFGLM